MRALLTGIRHEEILGGMLAQHRVALEDGDGLSSGVGDRHMGDMVIGSYDLHREWAGSEGGAGKGSNTEGLGMHLDERGRVGLRGVGLDDMFHKAYRGQTWHIIYASQLQHPCSPTTITTS